MKGWNYRVIRAVDGTFGICEAYYGKKDKVKLWSGPIVPQGESLDELRDDMLLMLGAFTRLVLDEVELKGYTARGEKT